MPKRSPIPRKPEFQKAEKEPAKVLAALQEIQEEADEEHDEEHDEEYMPSSASVCSSLFFTGFF